MLFSIFLLKTVFTESEDCLDLINFALGIKLQTVQPPTIWNQLQVDCCTTSGITCDGNQRVTRILWSSLYFDGIINGSAMPTNLVEMRLNDNRLTGTIPENMPTGLRVLDLQRNKLTGRIPVLPSNLNTLDVAECNLSGELPPFPDTLSLFYLSFPGDVGMRFTGTLRLNRPSQIFIYNNWITDIVIQDTSAIHPAYCDISNNPLLGNPNIARLTMCTQTGLYNATSLPKTVTIIQKMETFMLNIYDISTSRLPTNTHMMLETTSTNIGITSTSPLPTSTHKMLQKTSTNIGMKTPTSTILGANLEIGRAHV